MKYAHGVFARKYANEEIPMTSKLFIVMAQCGIDVDVDVVDLRAQADASMPASNNNVKLYNISNF